MLKGKTPLIIALCLGLAAALLAYKTIQQTEDRFTKDWALVPIVVASRDIDEGSQLKFEMVARMQSPTQFVTGSVVKPDQIERVVGQTIMAPLRRGDPLLWSHFYSEGTVERMSRIVRERGRAISMDFSGSHGLAGWLRPGDHVDILGTFTDPKDDQIASVTLLQNVVVLATGAISGATNVEALGKQDRGYKSVTLMVLPEEAEILTLAAELGSLRLTLRNESDMATMEERSRATVHTLMTGERIKTIWKLRQKLPDVIYLTPKGTK